MDDSLTADRTTDSATFEGFSGRPDELLSLLQYCQNQKGFISQENVREIACFLKVSEARVFGVASFYAQFRFLKPGDHQIRVCMGTACHVQEGDQLSHETQSLLGVGLGETTPDGRFDYQEVACLGCCAQASVVEIDGKIYGKMTREKLRKLLEAYEQP